MTELHCPRDRAVLASNEEDGHRHYTCGKCAGYWIGAAVLRRNMEPGALRGLIAKAAEAQPSALRCLTDGTPLAAIATHGCEIDLCPRCHSLWLDGGEVLKLAAIFQESGAIYSSALSEEEKPKHTGTVLFEGVFQVLMAVFR